VFERLQFSLQVLTVVLRCSDSATAFAGLRGVKLEGHFACAVDDMALVLVAESVALGRTGLPRRLLAPRVLVTDVAVADERVHLLLADFLHGPSARLDGRQLALFGSPLAGLFQLPKVLHVQTLAHVVEVVASQDSSVSGQGHGGGRVRVQVLVHVLLLDLRGLALQFLQLVQQLLLFVLQTLPLPDELVWFLRLVVLLHVVRDGGSLRFQIRFPFVLDLLSQRVQTVSVLLSEVSLLILFPVFDLEAESRWKFGALHQLVPQFFDLLTHEYFLVHLAQFGGFQFCN